MMPAEEAGDGRYKLIIELDYSHFVTFHGWFYLAQLIFGILSMACSAPAPFPTQVYFVIVVVVGFIGTILLSLAHLRFPTFNKMGKQAEFVYTAAMVLFYFTAFTAQFADFDGFLAPDLEHRYTAQIVAGVFSVFTELTLMATLYLMYPDAIMWYEEYKGETRPPASISASAAEQQQVE